MDAGLRVLGVRDWTIPCNEHQMDGVLGEMMKLRNYLWGLGLRI